MNLIDSMQEIASAHIDPGEPMELCDYGTVQGGSDLKRELKKSFWYQLTKSSTSQHKALDYNIVIVTERKIMFVPVKITAMGNRWKQKGDGSLETYPRDEVGMSPGEMTTSKSFGRQKAITVDFTLPDGSTKKVELYNNPERWLLLTK